MDLVRTTWSARRSSMPAARCPDPLCAAWPRHSRGRLRRPASPRARSSGSRSTLRARSSRRLRRPGRSARPSCSSRRAWARPSSRAVARGLAPTPLVTAAADARAHRDAPPAAAARRSRVDGLPPLALIARAPGERPAALAGAALVKLSSGSTGAPKAVVLTHANVAAEAANVAAALGLGPGRPRRRTGSADPLLRLRSRRARRARERRHRRAAPCRSRPRRALADMADATVYLGVPADLPRRAEAPVSAPPDLGGAALPAVVHGTALGRPHPRLRERFGAAICQHYGSSETGAVANHDPAAGARAAGLGRPGDRRRRGATSRRTPASSSCAEPRRRRRLRARRPAGPVAASPTASFRTGDLAEIDADGFIRIRGRRDSVINVGGLKVSPEEVVRGARAPSRRAPGGGRRRARTAAATSS